MTQLDYSGTELEVFRHAKNWKAYWAHAIAPFLGDEVLDVGAGIGATAINLRNRAFRRWVSLEPDPRFAKTIEELRVKGEIPAHFEVRNGSTSDLSSDELFDTILYIDVLEHIEADRAELVTAMRHLKPGGNIVVVSPAHNYLYTEFDRQIGHFRRYDARTLREITPPGLIMAACSYLDCVGMLASLANKAILKSGSPTIAQIKLWDGWMVPLSRVLDGVFGHKLGKSIFCAYEKPVR